MIKGIVFDLDGTLIDSMELWKNMGRFFLISQGKKPEKDLYTQIRNMDLSEAAEYFISRYDIGINVEEVHQHVMAMFSNAYENHIELKAFAKEVIHFLKSRNIRLCIVTATYSGLVDKVLKKHGLMEEFEFILSEEDKGMSKNNSQIYGKALMQLGFEADEVLLVDDSLYCLEAAKKLGIKTVGIWDKNAEMEQRALEKISDYYIKNLKELEKIVEEIQ